MIWWEIFYLLILSMLVYASKDKLVMLLANLAVQLFYTVGSFLLYKEDWLLVWLAAIGLHLLINFIHLVVLVLIRLYGKGKS